MRRMTITPEELIPIYDYRGERGEVVLTILDFKDRFKYDFAVISLYFPSLLLPTARGDNYGALKLDLSPCSVKQGDGKITCYTGSMIVTSYVMLNARGEFDAYGRLNIYLSGTYIAKNGEAVEDYADTFDQNMSSYEDVAVCYSVKPISKINALTDWYR